MVTARQIMCPGVETIAATASLAQAARRMRDLDIGALPVCAADGSPVGMITDRDIIVQCVAAGYDPQDTTADELVSGKLITVTADAGLGEVLTVMEDHRIRRLPVIDGTELVGMITETELASALSESEMSEFMALICAAV